MDETHSYHPKKEARYAELHPDDIPLAESLQDTKKRSIRHWEEVIAPQIRAGKTLVICGHENNMRSLIMHIEGLTPEQILNVELPRAMPLLFNLDADLKPIKLEGAAPLLSARYLGDAEEIKAIMDRDHRQVYDLNVRKNLEMQDDEPAPAPVEVPPVPKARPALKRERYWGPVGTPRAEPMWAAASAAAKAGADTSVPQLLLAAIKNVVLRTSSAQNAFISTITEADTAHSAKGIGITQETPVAR